MVPFAYLQAISVQEAVVSGAGHRSDQADESGADYFAGGTDMIQLMQECVRHPDLIVDITTLPGPPPRRGMVVHALDPSRA